MEQNFRYKRYAWYAVLKASLAESWFLINSFIIAFFIANTFIPKIDKALPSGTDNILVSIGTMMLYVVVFYFISILVNIFKYGGLIILIKTKLQSQKPMDRGMFLTYFLYTHLSLYTLIFSLDFYNQNILFQNFSPMDMAFLYGCCLMSPIAGLSKYLVTLELEELKDAVGQKEGDAMINSLEIKNKKVEYFSD